MKDQFFFKSSERIVKVIDAISYGGPSRGVIFDDWLTMVVSALSCGTQEAEYLSTIEKYKSGRYESRGKKPISELAGLFAVLVDEMTNEGNYTDILGDIFQGGITYGEAGQFFTPSSVTDLMASISCPPESDARTIHDPACGSGRMLLSVAKSAPHRTILTRTFHGQDVDHRCVKMTVINLCLWGLRGTVTLGNSLTNEKREVYSIDRHGPNLEIMVRKLEIKRQAESIPETVPVIESVQVIEPIKMKREKTVKSTENSPAGLFDSIS